MPEYGEFRGVDLVCSTSCPNSLQACRRSIWSECRFEVAVNRKLEELPPAVVHVAHPTSTMAQALGYRCLPRSFFAKARMSRMGCFAHEHRERPEFQQLAHRAVLWAQPIAPRACGLGGGFRSQAHPHPLRSSPCCFLQVDPAPIAKILFSSLAMQIPHSGADPCRGITLGFYYSLYPVAAVALEKPRVA